MRTINDTDPVPSVLGVTLDTINDTPDAAQERQRQREREPHGERSGPVISTLPHGSRIGDYILGELIATGGFGCVYRAEHALFGTPAAVKVLHPELALTREVVLRFEREVQAIRRVDHPNVVRILDFGDLGGGRPYFAMELLGGCDLETHLRSCGRVSPDEALAILEPVCSALSAAHGSSIIHRDLKASNVFLAQEGEVRRVVLLDFGVAKLLDDAGPGITTSSHILGTPACMAPEQITGRRTDERTDIYAVGALVYYLLTGELPFLDSSLVSLLHMHLYARPPLPSRVAPVSPAFDDIVLRAMAKEPEARYASVADLMAAFRAATLEARTESAPRSRRAGLRERRVAAIHIEICADARAMEDPDERLLADMERVLPLATALTEPLGFEIAMQTGNTMLLVSDIAEGATEELASRRAAIDVTSLLRRSLDKRDGRDERVYVSLCAHAGSVLVMGAKIIDGDLLDIGAWVPTESGPGVVVTAAIAEGLGLELEPAENDHYRLTDASSAGSP